MKKAALALGVIGAALMALDPNARLAAYGVMLISSSLFVWQLWGKEKEVVLLNAVYASLNVVGIATSL